MRHEAQPAVQPDVFAATSRRQKRGLTRALHHFQTEGNAMKAVLATILVFLSSAVAAFSDASEAQAIEAEATKLAEDFYKEHTLDCGGKTFFVKPASKATREMVYELRSNAESPEASLKVDVRSYVGQISAEDRLNGWEYQGMLETRGIRYFRKLLEFQSRRLCAVGDWQSTTDRTEMWHRLHKQKGRWQFINPRDLTEVKATRTACSDILACVAE